MIRVLDLSNRLMRSPIAQGLHAVRGVQIQHYDTFVGQEKQRTIQQSLGDGTWDSLVRLYYAGHEIEAADYHFHNGLGTDAPDAFFPDDDAHPWTAYYSARLPLGVVDETSDEQFGIFKTRRVANYNGAGQQVDVNGNIVPALADPRDHFFYSANPALHSTDHIITLGNRSKDIINWPAWADWRDYNDELITWDDARYVPRAISLTPATTGSLSPGNYYVRIAAVDGTDVSGASAEKLITLTGANDAFQVSWLLKTNIDNPPTPTGFRVYIGTAPGVYGGYFSVAGGGTTEYMVTTLTGRTAGTPPEGATAGLLRQIKRFESHLFFVPPYGLADALDRIMQISCADWQWANGKVRFMSPAARAPVFTLNLAEIGSGTFKTFPVDRRTRPNQIIVTFRDLDDQYLAESDPVIVPDPNAPDSDPRKILQTSEGRIKTHVIDGGCMYRSQAQRVASYWARVLIDSDQAATLEGSPKTYHVLPGDPVNVTHTLPGWTDIQFKVMRKEEHVEDRLGDPMDLLLYSPDFYSDTDHSPLVSTLPAGRIDPFAAPPKVLGLTLSTVARFTDTDVYAPGIAGVVEFDEFEYPQFGRVYWKRVGESEFVPTGIVVTPDSYLLGTFEVGAAEIGAHQFKVVPESAARATLGLTTADIYSHTVVGLPSLANVTGFAVDSASRGSIRFKLNAVSDLYLVGYLMERKDGAGAWTEVARFTGDTWTDHKLVISTSTYYRVRALARGGRTSPVPAELTFDIDYYGTSQPVVSATATKTAISVTITPDAALNDSGRASVMRTIVRVYTTTNPPFPAEPVTSITAEYIADGLMSTMIIPDQGLVTYNPDGTPHYVDVTSEIKALYGFVAAKASYPNGILGTESAGVSTPSAPFQNADLPLATTSVQGALVKAAHSATTAGAAVQADDPRLAAIANKQPLNSNLTTIAGLTPSNDDIIQRKSSAWVNRTPAQLKTDLALVKADVGLSNVANDAQLKIASNLADVANAATSRTNLGLGTTAAPTFGGATINGNMTVVAPVSPQVVVKADNTYSQFHLVAGEFKNYVTFYKDATPTRATSIGMSNPGINAMKDDILLCTFNGVVWAQKMSIGNGGVITIYDATAPISSIADGVQFWSESVGGSSELRVRDEAGNVTTLSAHAKDAPAWMYDPAEPQPPRIVREANVYTGMIRFTNQTRAARLVQMLIDGKPFDALSPESRKTIHDETFAEYNSRMKLAAGDAGYLVAEDWGANQEKLYQDREAERVAHAEAGKARTAQVAENKRRRDALAKWEKLPDEEKEKAEHPPAPDADPEPLQPVPAKYKKKSAPAWLAAIKRKAGQ